MLRLNDVITLPLQVGTWAFMYRGEGVEKVSQKYNRKNIALKIHHRPLRPDETMEEYLWGTFYLPEAQYSPLRETLVVQNLCAMRGLAPRVYGLETWTDHYGMRRPVQVVEDAGESDWSASVDSAKTVYDQIMQLGDLLGFTYPGFDNSVVNFVGGKWVDFQGFRLAPDYEWRMMNRFWASTKFGDRPYQYPLEDVGEVDTCRDTRTRISDLGLDNLGFVPERILDVGCSGGMFLNYFGRGLGIDHAKTIEAAREYSIFTGAWNVDYQAEDLNQYQAGPFEQYDLVLFLNVSHHIGLPQWVRRVAQKRIICEFHASEQEEGMQWVEKHFEILKSYRSADYKRLVVHGERK